MVNTYKIIAKINQVLLLNKMSVSEMLVKSQTYLMESSDIKDNIEALCHNKYFYETYK